MDLSSLRPAKGAVKNRKRIGRGPGSGNGTTAGKGNKGQQSRSGYQRPVAEGGQMPIYRRLPKFGFTPPNRKKITAVNVDQLQMWIEKGLVGNEIGLQELKSLCSGSNQDMFKVLGNGELSSAVTITAHFFSKSAEEKIAAAGGKTVKAFRTLEEAARIGDLPLEEAILKPKAKVVKVTRKRPVKS